MSSRVNSFIVSLISIPLQLYVGLSHTCSDMKEILLDLEEFNVTLRWGTALKQVLNIMMFCHVLLPDLKSFLLNTCSINYSMYELKEISCNHQRQQTANIYGYYSNMNTYSPQPHHNIKGSRTFLLNILYFLEISISAFITFVSHTCRTTELKIGHMMRY